MRIEGATALVTGANRGLGKAFVEALLAAGAAKVYAAARDPGAVADARVASIRLDVTRPEEVALAAEHCRDVTLLVNNAGAMLLTPVLAEGAEAALRHELEVNVLGVQRTMQAFAPVIARNGGGAIANMLSVVSLYVYPFNGTYGVSKHAAAALTEGARIQLRRQGVHVAGIYAGFIDTDMAADVAAPKTAPREVAERALQGLREGRDHIFGDDRSWQVWERLRRDPGPVAAELQQAWDAGASAWSR